MKHRSRLLSIPLLATFLQFMLFPSTSFAVNLVKTMTLYPEEIVCADTRNGFGESMATGDLDGDGFDDLIVTNPTLVHNEVGTIFYGGPNLTGQMFTEKTALDISFAHVALADVNDDGYPDLIVGRSGWVYAFHGGPTRFPATLTSADANWSAEVFEDPAWSGKHTIVALAGDNNGDGIDDIIVSLSSSSANDNVYGFYGSPSGLPADKNHDYTIPPGLWSQGGTDYDIQGFSKVGKDGHTTAFNIDNFMIGAPNSYTDLNGNGFFLPSEQTGAVLIGPRFWILTGDNVVTSKFGYAIGNAGDVNNDGHPEVLASAVKTSTRFEKVFLYLGSSDRVSLHSYDWFVEGTSSTSGAFGEGVGGIGDIDGDGYGDILIGDPRYDNMPSVPGHLGYWGRVFLYFGGPAQPGDPSGLGTGRTPANADLTLSGDSASGWGFGSTFAAGDFNGDGHIDLALGDPRGAHFCSPSPIETGRVFVYVNDVPASSSITVTSPNGGESWVAGTTHNITWTSIGAVGNVQIELHKGGVLNSTIVASTANTGSYPWQIPAGQNIGSDYRVRISSVSTPSVSDTGNGNFSILRRMQVDFDLDGKTDLTVWRPGSGVWYIKRSSDGTMLSPQWGLGSLGDVPVPGDYDEDGKIDVAVWRPSNGVWYIQRSLDGGMMSPQWGLGSLGDVPVPGDYDGDGKADVAVWRPDSGVWYVQRSSDGGMLSPQWGLGSLGDVPVPGDYDGDGKTDVAVWRPSNGVWYIQKSSDGGMLSPQWGLGSLGDVTVPSDYDRDGKTDVAVWRPSTGTWYILRSSDGGMTSPQWGMSGDNPMNRPVHLWASP